MADGDMPTKPALPRDVNRIGDSFIFPPRVMDDIHIKSELGRYRMRGVSLFKKSPHWDDLTFLPGTLTRFVIEGYRGRRCGQLRSQQLPRMAWRTTTWGAH